MPQTALDDGGRPLRKTVKSLIVPRLSKEEEIEPVQLTVGS
jgi:hypothetical protein